jgi:hypothetical protein
MYRVLLDSKERRREGRLQKERAATERSLMEMTKEPFDHKQRQMRCPRVYKWVVGWKKVQKATGSSVLGA